MTTMKTIAATALVAALLLADGLQMRANNEAFAQQGGKGGDSNADGRLSDNGGEGFTRINEVPTKLVLGGLHFLGQVWAQGMRNTLGSGTWEGRDTAHAVSSGNAGAWGGTGEKL